MLRLTLAWALPDKSRCQRGMLYLSRIVKNNRLALSYCYRTLELGEYRQGVLHGLQEGDIADLQFNDLNENITISRTLSYLGCLLLGNDKSKKMIKACLLIQSFWRHYQQGKVLKEIYHFTILQADRRNEIRINRALLSTCEEKGKRLTQEEQLFFETLRRDNLIVQHGSRAAGIVKELLSAKMLVLRKIKRPYIYTVKKLGKYNSVFFARKNLSLRANIPCFARGQYAYEKNLSLELKSSTANHYKYWASDAFYSYYIEKVMPPIKLGDTTLIVQFSWAKNVGESTQKCLYLRNDKVVKEEAFHIGGEVYLGRNIQKLSLLRIIQQLRYTSISFRKYVFASISNKDIIEQLFNALLPVSAREINANVLVDVREAKIIPPAAVDVEATGLIFHALENGIRLPTLTPEILNTRVKDIDGVEYNFRGYKLFLTTPLCFAVVYSDLKVVKELLDAGADPNYHGANFVTPLICAVVARRIDIVALLLEFPIKMAQREGRQIVHLVNPYVYSHIFDKGGVKKYNITPLQWACLYLQDIAVVDLLLHHQAGFHPGPIKFIKQKLCKSAVLNLFANAISHNYTKAALWLLSHFPSINVLAELKVSAVDLIKVGDRIYHCNIRAGGYCEFNFDEEGNLYESYYLVTHISGGIVYCRSMPTDELIGISFEDLKDYSDDSKVRFSVKKNILTPLQIAYHHQNQVLIDKLEQKPAGLCAQPSVKP